MNSLKAIFYIFCFCIASTGFAQNEDVPFDKKIFADDKLGFEQAVKSIRTGDSYFFDGKDELVDEALKHYLDAQKFNPYSSMLNYKIGVCYLYSANKLNSLAHFQFVEKVNPEIDPELDFYLGQSYQLWGEFDLAIEYYNSFKQSLNDNDSEQAFFIERKIQECNTGLELIKSPIRVWIDNLGDSINTEYSEFSPVISADNKVLFFTGRRPDSEGGKTDRSGKYYEDIYFSKREFKEEWQTAKNIGKPINTESHDATVGIAADGKSVFIYKGINAKNGDLFITRELDDKTWAEPQSIGDGINTKYHESSASLSFDEQTLFFVSNKPGGFGQHDIYKATWNTEKEKWTDVQNLGSVINTEFEEKGVFYHDPTRTLYFSSDGHANMGGLDVFKTIYNEEDNSWSKPENIGYPINTPDDDIYFVVTGNSRYAYYSSWRQDGFGEKDIYKITFLGAAKKPAVIELQNELQAFEHQRSSLTSLEKDQPKFLLSGQLTDSDGNGIPGQLTIKDRKTDNIIKKVNTLADGYYSVLLDPGKEIEIEATSDGFQFGKKQLTTDMVVPAYEELNFVLGGKGETPLDMIVKNDDPEKSDDVIRNRVNQPSTDDTPKEDGSNGTTGNSTTTADEQIAENNEQTNQSSEEVKKDGNKTNTIEDEPVNTDTEEHVTQKEKVNIDEVAVSTNKKENETVKGTIESSGTAKSEYNIYFAFDQAKLNHVAFNASPQKTLDELAENMRNNPSMKIELGGHTDQRGDAKYNQYLSEKRAEIAKQYLVKKGIDAARIKAKGYGEQQPVISLSEIRLLKTNREKEVAYQKNRRTVVKILNN